MKINLFFIINLLFIFLTGCASNFGERPDVQGYIQKISYQHHFDQITLTNLFNQVHPRKAFIQQSEKPKEKTASWNTYRHIFITPKRIEKGRIFWLAHQKTLHKAYQQYQVNSEIIIGILGVETQYGEFMGHDRIIDSLSTLTFNYPARQKYFQNELTQYLLLTREFNFDPLALKGSYAGAMGIPQFMPSNYRKLAVSNNPSRSPNLFTNPDDAILSVANYFHHMGWRKSKTLTHHNFNVIKRYNNSDYYAMAVYQLGLAVKQKISCQK